MLIDRRALVLGAVAGVAGASAAQAQSNIAAWESPRFAGSQDAKNVVEEWFSLTCTHCAHFAEGTFQEVKKNLIDTGKVRWVFRDFPLDRVALAAAMVARALPPDRYEPFIMALFASQDRWAFAQGGDPMKELWNMAALAGMNKATFDAVVKDQALQDWVLAQQNAAEKKYGIDATPSFVVNGKKYSGEMSYADFAKLIPVS